MATRLKVSDLPEAAQRKFGLKSASKRVAFSKEKVRQRAILVLAELVDLSIDERRRVLSHALQVNKI